MSVFLCQDDAVSVPLWPFGRQDMSLFRLAFGTRAQALSQQIVDMVRCTAKTNGTLESFNSDVCMYPRAADVYSLVPASFTGKRARLSSLDSGAGTFDQMDTARDKHDLPCANAPMPAQMRRPNKPQPQNPRGTAFQASTHK